VFYYKYPFFHLNSYFQNNCIPIRLHAKNKEMIVLVVIPSPKKYQVKKVKEIIPEPKAMNLPGHNSPSKC